MENTSSSVTFSPVDINALQVTKDLLLRMYLIRGKGIITGQHDWIMSPFTFYNSISTKAGVYPGVHGFEIGGFDGQTDSQLLSHRNSTASAAITSYKANSIATFTYHTPFPGTERWWSNVQRKTTDEEFNLVLTPGTPQNQVLMKDFSLIADQFKKLQDAGVPLFFRPYHEMNGGWFWWGNRKNFIELWNMTYDYFINVRGLHNILWVWSPNAENNWSTPFAQYFPGLNKVDALAVDLYDTPLLGDSYTKLTNLAGGKLIGLGEVGLIPDIETIKNKYPNYSWFMTWAKPNDWNSDAFIKNSYSNGYAANRNSRLLTDSLDILAPVPKPVESTLISQGKTISASSYLWGDTPSKLVDGNKNTRWQSDYTDNEWVMIDLGKDYTVTKINLHYLYHRPKSYSIQISNDKEKWITIKDIESSNTFLDSFDFEGISCKYIKFNFTKRTSTTYVFNIQEIEILGY
ncbi:Mannan endo-1,4-beta-mannosidase [compost metagenome]